MRIKTKLTLGVGLLFMLITLISVLGVVQINRLSTDTENILEANYQSLEYARMMSNSVENINSDPTAAYIFESALERQEKNVTENGEKEATESAHIHFEAFKKEPNNSALKAYLQKDIDDLFQLNMNAINRKSEVANKTAFTATIWIITGGSICLLIALLLLIKLPKTIANPITELTERIKEISNKNYQQKVEFESDYEFRELAKAFNQMASKLQEFENSNIFKLLFEKKRIDTLINNMHDPVIGLDEKHNITFANHQALLILGIKKRATDRKIGQRHIAQQ